MSVRSLSAGERIPIEPGLTTEIEGVAQAFEHLDDEQYLSVWDEARNADVNVKGDPRGRIKRIRDFFRNRSYVRDLCTEESYQLPIFSVAPVPGGSVTANYSVERSGDGGASIRVLGSGGGAGFKTVLGSSFEFNVDRADLMSSIVRDVVVTAHLFDHDGESEIVTDIRLVDDAFVRVDSALPALAPESSAGRLVVRLLAADPVGEGKYTFHTERSLNWKVDVGLHIENFGIPIEAGLSYEATKTSGVEATFVLPNGYDYYAYDWSTGGSLVPRIAPGP
jgi:hypothetical protein